MGTSNKRKSEFLKMPFSTASHRLKKQIMLRLLQRLNADICFNCEQQIINPEELSVEHIKPWLNREDGQELFWDLDNIAFSHVKCNLPHNYERPTLRKIGPVGTAWCTDCQGYKDTTEFNKHSGRWNGFQAQCIEHKTIRNKQRYS